MPHSVAITAIRHLLSFISLRRNFGFSFGFLSVLEDFLTEANEACSSIYVVLFVFSPPQFFFPISETSVILSKHEDKTEIIVFKNKEKRTLVSK